MLRPGAHAAAERLCAFVLALATLGLFAITLEVKDALLRPASGLLSVALRDAVLGRNAVGVAITIIATALAACAVYWVGVRWAAGGANALTLVLGVLVTLLLFLLPIQQGVFWADRFVRVLERAPDENAGTASPVWLVDRSRDKVVLLVRDAAKKPKLVTFGADKLDGIAVTGTSSLDQLVGSLERP